MTPGGPRGGCHQGGVCQGRIPLQFRCRRTEIPLPTGSAKPIQATDYNRFTTPMEGFLEAEKIFSLLSGKGHHGGWRSAVRAVHWLRSYVLEPCAPSSRRRPSLRRDDEDESIDLSLCSPCLCGEDYFTAEKLVDCRI